jgi:lysophospholipase L1-like esterase
VYPETRELNRFEADIRIFEIRDHFRPPPEGAVLFAGSSTFRKWDDLVEQLPGHLIINRGFGGSTMADLNHFFDRIVLPYLPTRIFIYEGDNDIARGSSPEEFIQECRKFIRSCRDDLPDAELYFVSIKPSPARFSQWDQMSRANRMLQSLCSETAQVNFIDITRAILDENGRPDPGLFVADRLHFNREGYQAIADILNPILNP